MEDNVKYIESLSGALCELEVVECGCGYHLGVDASYLEQVGSIETKCPSCGFEIHYGKNNDDSE